MRKSPLQFSLASLLLTVAVVAGVLALMLQVPTKPAQYSLMVVVIVMSSLCIAGAINGQTTLRTYCVGALLPLAMMVILFMTNFQSLITSFYTHLAPFDGGTYTTVFFGFGILLSIALGYLCVGFLWLIERREPPDA